MADLKSALADDSVSTGQLKEKMDAVRAVRRKLKNNLDTAQKELIEAITTRQEAMLLSLGYID
jgi:hypothetical protein